MDSLICETGSGYTFARRIKSLRLHKTGPVVIWVAWPFFPNKEGKDDDDDNLIVFPPNKPDGNSYGEERMVFFCWEG